MICLWTLLATIWTLAIDVHPLRGTSSLAFKSGVAIAGGMQRSRHSFRPIAKAAGAIVATRELI